MRERVRQFLARLARLRENKALPFLAGAAVVFLALSIAVHSPGLLSVDRAITLTIQRSGNDAVTRVASAFTFLGNTTTLIIIGAFTVATFTLFRKPWAALLTAATLLSLPLNILLKGFVGRPRPTGDLVDVLLPAVGLSFPSGHAMASVAFFGFLALMAWVHLPRRKRRTFFVTAFLLIAVCISLSRIYVGAHWFSDVLGGWTAGSFFLLLLAEIYKVAANAELKPPPMSEAHAPARS
jgi:membrane-associated phospholipid phosphatase